MGRITRYELRNPLAPSGKYILVRVTANITRALALQFSQDAYRLGAQHNLNRYLFDVRAVRNVESAVSNYEYVNQDKVRGEFPHPSRAAVLVAEGDKSHNFVVTVNRNAGFNFRRFTEEAEAIAWLETHDLY